MKKSALAILFSSLLATVANAELSNCNGVWTNEPCEGNTSQRLEEKDYTPQDPQKSRQSKKEQLLHDLRMKQLNSVRAYKVDIAIDAAETICSDPVTTLKECQDQVTELRDKIDNAVLAVRELEIKEKKIEAEKAEAKAKAENNTTTITIIKERHRHPRHDSEYRQIPGNYHRERRSEHSGFSVGGSLSGSNATISGNLGYGSSETATTIAVEDR